jgi:Ca2+-binding EF-hand superfamily protein
VACRFQPALCLVQGSFSVTPCHLLIRIKRIGVWQDGDGVITKLEFLTRILVKMKRCTDEDVKEILRIFDSLDKDGSGELSNTDIDYDELRNKLKHLPSTASDSSFLQTSSGGRVKS